MKKASRNALDRGNKHKSKKLNNTFTFSNTSKLLSSISINSKKRKRLLHNSKKNENTILLDKCEYETITASSNKLVKAKEK